jgi:hypothetical protein
MFQGDSLSVFRTKILYAFLFCCKRATCTAHLNILYLIPRVRLGSGVKIMTLFFRQYPHIPCYLLSRRPKYLTRHPIVECSHPNFCRFTVHFEIYVLHSPTNALFIKLVKSFKFTLKYTIISLLRVSVFNDHHQGDLSVPD